MELLGKQRLGGDVFFHPARGYPTEDKVHLPVAQCLVLRGDTGGLLDVASDAREATR